MYTRMALVYVLTALVATLCARTGHGSMMNKCLKVLANEEFHKTCSSLDSDRIRPCLVKTQQDADVLIGTKVIGGGTPIPTDHICAAREEMMDADCISVHVKPDAQQTWQWTDWRHASYGIVRNFVITEGHSNYTCPYEDRYTRPVHTDCQAAYLSGQTTSGVYSILPDASTVLKVYCEMELDGGGWTVIQRRLDGSLDFRQTWAMFKAGFGDLEGEFWLGNDNIHLLTKDHDQQIKFHLKSSDGEEAFADYSHFSLDDESLKYKLTISGYSGAAIPGDSMSANNGDKFSTIDQDNDSWAGSSCAIVHIGAWWHGSCHRANLNGDYGNTAGGNGLNWMTWKGYRHSMSYTAIMVKQR